MGSPSADPARTAVHSYEFLRRAIGIVGLALPWVLALGNLLVSDGGLLDSISDYYHSDMRDVFVGSMCAVGVFLLSYYGHAKLDDIASTTAGLGAIGLALCPTLPPGDVTSADRVFSALHATFAAVFFLTLAAFCLLIFTKSDKPKEQRTSRKIARNRVYQACGGIMLVCLVLIALGNLGLVPALAFAKHTFWEEGVAITAFGAAWFVKGRTILRDRVVRG